MLLPFFCPTDYRFWSLGIKTKRFFRRLAKFCTFAGKIQIPLHRAGEVGMKTDGKTLFLLLFLYFFAKTGAGSKIESEYADIRKRINTDGEPKN
jgi:hypothetical protein